MITVSKKPLAVVLGAAFALTGAVAQASVFQTADLGAGYMVAAADAPTTAADSAATPAPAKEHKQHKKAADEKSAQAKADADAAAEAKHSEGKCGENKCGQMKKK